jgi:hypothetical protein
LSYWSQKGYNYYKEVLTILEIIEGMKMYKKIICFVVSFALIINIPLSAIETAKTRPEIAQESNSTFKELKKLMQCIKQKNGCSKKQIAAIVGVAAGIVALITGGLYVGYRVLKKGTQVLQTGAPHTADMTLIDMVVSDQPITQDMLQGMSPEQINAKNEEGQTPLMLAAKKKDFNLAWLLIKAGADIKVTDNKGETAIDYISEDEQNVKIPLYFLLNSVFPKGWEAATLAEKKSEVVNVIVRIIQSNDESWENIQRYINDSKSKDFSEKDADDLIKNVEDSLQQMQQEQQVP